MPVMFVKEVTKCPECPCCEVKRHYTRDSFETVFDWICTKNCNAIAATVEWNDKAPPIPQWCPLRIEGN